MPVVRNSIEYEFLLAGSSPGLKIDQDSFGKFKPGTHKHSLVGETESQFLIAGELGSLKTSAKYRILAEGDSWFKYPKSFFAFGESSNIIDCLGEREDLYIESDSENGRELLEIFSGAHKNNLLGNIYKAAESGNNYDLLLVSGGGNDIVGEFDFDWMIRENQKGKVAGDFIRQENLERKVNRLGECYAELIERVLEQDSQVRIVGHQYDYARPIPKGFWLFDWLPLTGSWMYPYLMRKHISDHQLQLEIVRELFDSFSKMMDRLEKEYASNFSVVKTLGTLKEDQWRNEIHPTPEGFRILSSKFEQEIRKKKPSMKS